MEMLFFAGMIGEKDLIKMYNLGRNMSTNSIDPFFNILVYFQNGIRFAKYQKIKSTKVRNDKRNVVSHFFFK